MTIFDPKAPNYMNLKDRKRSEDYRYAEGCTPNDLTVKKPNGQSILPAPKRDKHGMLIGMPMPFYGSRDPEDTRKYLIRAQRKLFN